MPAHEVPHRAELPIRNIVALGKLEPAWMTVAPPLVEREPPPAPMSLVLFGKVNPLLMTIVPGGRRIVEGGGVVLVNASPVKSHRLPLLSVHVAE